MLSNRIADKVIDSGFVGTRIAWVKIKGPVCNIFFIVTYIPHKGRNVTPVAQDTLSQLKQLLQTINRSDCVILGGDFNCQLPRNVENCTGQWCMTKRYQKGHDKQVINLMREHDLFAVDTLFKPKRRKWGSHYRYCNATYLPKDSNLRPTKLDYICVSNRWKSQVINSDVRWGPSVHRFGQPFDHGFLSATWRWRTKNNDRTRRPDFKAMTGQMWPTFNEELRIRLQKETQPPSNSKEHPPSVTQDEDGDMANLACEYESLATCVFDTIQKVVPEKKWLKKNGRVVTQETKELFEKRAAEYQKKKPTRERKKRWNRVISNACKNDYRRWVSNWVRTIEQADEKGDTKTIYRGVKTLSGCPKATTTRPTLRKRREDEIDAKLPAVPEIIASDKKNEVAASGKPEIAASGSEKPPNPPKVAASHVRINGPQELAQVWQEFLASKFSQTELEK